jgi:hypothetical protein
MVRAKEKRFNTEGTKVGAQSSQRRAEKSREEKSGEESDRRD